MTKSTDCNANGVWDACDVAYETSEDCDNDGVPDECQGNQVDCNENGVGDLCDIGSGTSRDCNGNAVPDACDVTSGTSPDCNIDGVPDECDLVPLVVPAGSRYLTITPAEFGDEPVTLRITGFVGDADVSCVSLYVQPDGMLGSVPVPEHRRNGVR